MAKSSKNWINPTPTSNRFSALQQEDDLVNQPSPGKEATPNPPFISPVSLPSLHYSDSLIKTSNSFTKSKPSNKIRLKSNLKLLTPTALSQKPFWIEIRNFIPTNLKKTYI
jgi:hypothetical protein